MESVDFSGLPGGELIRRGLKDLAAGRESEEALLVLIGAPRLRRLGLDVPEASSDHNPLISSHHLENPGRREGGECKAEPGIAPERTSPVREDASPKRQRRRRPLSTDQGSELPEHRLYRLLAHSDADSAHSRYNALIRRLVSFERALECVA